MSFKSAVNPDDQIRNGALSAWMKASATLGLLSAVPLAVIFLFSAEVADDIKIPIGYRNWFHVNTMVIDKPSPLFEVLGGIIHIHSSERGITNSIPSDQTDSCGPNLGDKHEQRHKRRTDPSRTTDVIVLACYL
jgi:hypothetical protein